MVREGGNGGGPGRKRGRDPLDPDIVWCGEEGRPRPPGPRPQAHCLSKLLEPGGGQREEEEEEDGVRTQDPLPSPLLPRRTSQSSSAPAAFEWKAVIPTQGQPPPSPLLPPRAPLRPALPRPLLEGHAHAAPPAVDQRPAPAAAVHSGVHLSCTHTMHDVGKSKLLPPFPSPLRNPPALHGGGLRQGMRQCPYGSLAQGQAYTPLRAVPSHLQGQQAPPTVCVLQNLDPRDDT